MAFFARAKAAHLRLGAAGERAAVRMFENKGYEILARDCRMHCGEIDIVARDGLSLIFAEVKTRRLRKNIEVTPAANLRPAQKRRIYRAAFAYMKKIGKPDVTYRFDLVEVLFSGFRLSMMYHRKAIFGEKTMKRKNRMDAVNYFD